MAPAFLKRIRLRRVTKIPAPVTVASLVIVLLCILGIQNNGRYPIRDVYLRKDGSKQKGRAPPAKDPRKCFDENPWITKSLDHFFKPVLESAERSDQTSEESIEAMGNIKWGEYHPGQDVVELLYNKDRKTYDVNITERHPANQPHKSRCIRMVMERALEEYSTYLAEQLHGRDFKFVVTTEDFGLLFRGENFRLPSFALSTDHDHIDIPVPDFTFGCYPETKYENDSWHDVRTLLLNEGDSRAWSDRKDVIFHRSNWDVGPRRGLMPLLEKLHKKGKDKETLGMVLDIGNTGFVVSNEEKFVYLHEQCVNKVLIHTAGFSYSAGLKYKLACGSLVIKFKSKFEEFFEPGLEDGVHAVMVDASHEGVDEGTFFNVSAPRIKKAVRKTINKHSSIAKGGQDFIRRNLTDEALNCYWYGALLRYGDLYAKYYDVDTPSKE